MLRGALHLRSPGADAPAALRFALLPADDLVQQLLGPDPGGLQQQQQQQVAPLDDPLRVFQEFAAADVR